MKRNESCISSYLVGEGNFKNVGADRKVKAWHVEAEG
jgi:hypothetical protein